MGEFNFEKLDVYQKALEFGNKVYSLTKEFPQDEKFGLTSQLRRAAVSIALNIAEGTTRTNKEFARFLDISRGSVLESTTILAIALKQEYIDRNKFNETKEELVELSKMLCGLKSSLKK